MTDRLPDYQLEPCTRCNKLTQWPRGLIEKLGTTGVMHRVPVLCDGCDGRHEEDE